MVSAEITVEAPHLPRSRQFDFPAAEKRPCAKDLAAQRGLICNGTLLAKMQMTLS
jgi:hypothetical protein